ncbi:MAG: pyridoxine 5'-phosphate synthase [Deltaproteobacteria bacterium]|nr:MAG: pyridoxine 5'-phosphate synthase [Deltaproteobacteria bacterium]TMB33060.1 MAG: pyridoxine 5'-phosphate synthase [Deltaproteobacteria bacterium]
MRLGVNIDHVATLRQARKGRYPDPVAAAALAELGGADQITLHVREDRRHVNDRDLDVLRKTVNGTLNLEMAAVQPMLNLALQHRPDTATLVPERREELTTEGGLDVISNREEIRRVAQSLRDASIEVSLFVDPDLEQIKASHRADAQAVELHTGRYCEARTSRDRARELARIVEGAKAATKLGLRVAAGHGLDYWNVKPVAEIAEITELNIGYAIVCRAILTGLERAVRDMKDLIG